MSFQKIVFPNTPLEFCKEMKIISLIKIVYRNARKEYKILKWAHPHLIGLIERTLLLLPEKIFIRLKFRYRNGYPVNLANPKTLNEKINWLKLNDRTPLHSICADKYKVRDFVESKIGGEFLIPLVAVYENAHSINLENLPDFPTIIKTNNSSGKNIIIWDKSKIDICDIKRKFNQWLGENTYYKRKEWQYKNIKPLILIEKLLVDSESSAIPDDIKIHCFNGEPEFFQIDKGRFSNNHCRYLLDLNWKKTPFSWNAYKGNGKYTNIGLDEIERPKNFNLLLELARKLSSDFLYVRIDFYECNDSLFFGEITFHHESGFRPILPFEYDVLLGQKIRLPKL